MSPAFRPLSVASRPATVGPGDRPATACRIASEGVISAGEHDPATSMQFIRVVRWIALLASAMLLPFLPGRHDALAMSLSAAATGAAFGGLLLVPIGVGWLISSRGYALANLALAVATLVTWGAGALAAMRRSRLLPCTCWGHCRCCIRCACVRACHRRSVQRHVVPCHSAYARNRPADRSRRHSAPHCRTRPGDRGDTCSPRCRRGNSDDVGGFANR